MKYSSDTPPILRDFLTYHETIMGHSKNTVDEYYLDLRLYFRFLKLNKGLVPRDTDIEDISISDVDISLIKDTGLSDVYEFLGYLSRDRETHQNARYSSRGLGARSRARKIATLRSFYKYLSSKANLLDENPLSDLDSPKVMKSLPRYLSLDESKQLLSSIDGPNKKRDYCIIMIFLTCGLRISELIGLNLSDVRADHLRVLGKGNKERIVYLNDACADAINQYLEVRKKMPAADKNALFLSSRKVRISRSAVHNLVKNHISEAGLDSTKYSSHKLRHTAATLMLHNGVDVRTLQELLGHEHLNTTEIYTHVENAGLRNAASLSPLSNFKPDTAENVSNNAENDGILL